MNNRIALLLSSLLIGYQLLRVITFANVYGGFEHDGGWMLSISRSLAEQGTYTTMVSTLPDPNEPGGINVDDKFDLQAADGRIWFFTGNGIGPASIIPDAIVIKLFGSSFWALKAGPLMFYALFLILACTILYRLAGMGAVILFHAYLFCYPHISIFLAYEAMGEVPSMFYILAAYLVFAWAMEQNLPPSVPPKGREVTLPLPMSPFEDKGEGRGEVKLPRPMGEGWGEGKSFLLAGLAISLAINAKLITLWSVSGIVLWAMFLWARQRLTLSQWLAMGSGMVSLTILWEFVHFVVLTYLTNFELYKLNLWQRIKFILDDGSGVGQRLYAGPEFWADKFFLLGEVAHPERWVTGVIFGLIFGGGLWLIWQMESKSLDLTAKSKDLDSVNLFAPMWLGWLVNTLWFVGLAKTGWPRHFWFGLVLAMMLACILTVTFLRPDKILKPHRSSRPTRFDYAARGYGATFLILILWGFISQPHVWGFFVPAEIVPYWQQKQINNKYHASLPWIIIPRADQEAVVNYIKTMPPEAHVFYPSGHKNAEIPAQVGRVFYPLKRRDFMTPNPQDIVLIGPSLISPWMPPVRRADLLRLVQSQCPAPIIQNDFYMICPFSN